MTSGVLSVHERIELIKLAKSLAIKTAQIVVQSRDGNKIHTRCNPVSTDSMFNLAFPELIDVEKQVKRALISIHSCDRWSLCIEIFLKTVDGDIMTLETWSVSLVSGRCDYINSFPLYSRLGIILKSLLAVTRVVPAYRYSRRQNADSYIIGHRIYAGEPQCNSLGDKYKYVKVGNVSTPIGTIQLAVSYRTVMTISPQPSGINMSIMVKSDHFRPDFSPKHNRNQHSDENNSTEELNYKVGAFVESRRESMMPFDSDQIGVIPTVPFGSLLTTVKASFQQSPPTNAVNGNELCERLKVIDFNKDEVNGNVTVTKSATSYNDDFIVVDLVKPPFAESTGNVELGTFYQEWKTAPPLQACPIDPKVIDQVGDLTSQLATYETSLKEFDHMVTSLCEETDTNENTSPFEL